MFKTKRVVSLLALLGAPFLASTVWATDPEIMVHEADLAESGEIVATLHANYTPRGGRDTGDYTWPSHRQLNLMAEFATGIAPGWEVGVHLPIRRAGVDSPSSSAGDWGATAVMFRLKHISELESGFFFGFNAEYDYFARRFDTASRGIEFRGIVGYDHERFRLTLNPTFTWGFGRDADNHRADFGLDGKLLYKVSEKLAYGIEAYSDWGKYDQLRPGDGGRVVYLVSEFELAKDHALHVGVGKGYRDADERTVLKAVWSTSF